MNMDELEDLLQPAVSSVGASSEDNKERTWTKELETYKHAVHTYRGRKIPRQSRESNPELLICGQGHYSQLIRANK